MQGHTFACKPYLAQMQLSQDFMLVTLLNVTSGKSIVILSLSLSLIQNVPCVIMQLHVKTSIFIAACLAVMRAETRSLLRCPAIHDP